MTPAFLSYLNDPWVKDTLQSLNLEQRLAQSLHIPAWSDRGDEHLTSLLELVEAYGVGGIIFFQGTADWQITFTQALQAASPLPLLIGQDAEWGLAMRLRDQEKYPYAMTLGATRDPVLIEEVAYSMGQQLRQLGVHINYAPVADINTQPQNPVIGFRSFGDQAEQVGIAAHAFAQGLMRSGILPVFKHFPGHGDTEVDSHLAMPVLPHQDTRLQSVEQLPFGQAIAAGMPAIMTAHLHVPAWDSSPGRTVTHSKFILSQQLRNALNFQGMIFTDALDMGGITHSGAQADINANAYLAGHDILLFCNEVPETLARLKAAVDQGLLSATDISHRCHRILALKRWLEHAAQPPSSISPLPTILWSKVAQQAISLLRPDQFFPISGDQPVTLYLISLEPNLSGELRHHELISRGKPLPPRTFTELWPTDSITTISLNLDEWHTNTGPISPQANQVIVVTDIPLKAKAQFGLTAHRQQALRRLFSRVSGPLVWLGNPYALAFVPDLNSRKGILVGYEDHPAMRTTVVDILLGQQTPRGTLPFSHTHLPLDG